MEFTLEKLRESVSSLSAEEHGFTHLDLDRRPQTQGRLSGWILSAKDLNDVVGMPTTLGHKARTYFPDVTDPFIADLRRRARFSSASRQPPSWVCA